MMHVCVGGLFCSAKSKQLVKKFSFFFIYWFQFQHTLGLVDAMISEESPKIVNI